MFVYQSFRIHQVGYAFAINWVLMSLLLLPAATMFVMGLIRVYPSVLARLAGRGMLVDDQFTRIDEKQPIADWNRTASVAYGMVAILFVIALVQPLAEWFSTSARPLATNSLDKVAEHEFDWAVAAQLRSENPPWTDRMTNAAFSLAVFVVQSGVLMIIAYLLVFAFATCYFSTGHNAVSNHGVVGIDAFVAC